MKDRINYYIFLPLIFLAFFLETAFLPPLLWTSLPLRPVMIVIFASAFLSLSSDFLYTAFLLGFLLDVYSGSGFGILTASAVVSAIGANSLKEKFLKEERPARVAELSAAAMLLFNLSYFCLLSVSGEGGDFDAAFIGKDALLDSLAAAILVYPVMRLVSKGKE